MNEATELLNEVERALQSADPEEVQKAMVITLTGINITLGKIAAILEEGNKNENDSTN
jgi:hypothetical protein